ncbi:MAG: YfhO family protein [Candidatus Omnitrophica bacterium]|nr:YfhO family protein [Candidatus Omnitrophota bacterium]
MDNLKKIRIDTTLLGLILVLVYINHFTLLYERWPIQGDLGEQYKVFHIFYSHYFFNHKLIEWLPFAHFGLPSLFLQLNYLTPAKYLAGIAGAVFSVSDAFWLFKVSAVIEQLLLMLGTYFLSLRLFRDRSVAVICCLLMMASSLWICQLLWNLESFYLLPLECFFLKVFWDSGKRSDFLKLILCLIFSFIGIPFYLILLNSFIMALLFWTMLSAAKGGARPGIFKAEIILLCSAIAILFFFHFRAVAQIRGFLPGFGNFTPVLHEMFFGHFVGTAYGPLKFFGLIFPNFQHTAGLFYVGLPAVVFIFYSIIQEEDVFYVCMGRVLAMLLILPVTAVFIFHQMGLKPWDQFPLFHVDVLSGHIRFFMMMLAGFGVQRFLKDVRARPAHIQRSVFLLCAIFTVVLWMAAFQFNIKFFYPLKTAFDYFLFAQLLILTLIIGGRKMSVSKYSAVLILFFAFDILSYWNFFYAYYYQPWPLVHDPQTTDVRRVDKNTLLSSIQAEGSPAMNRIAGADLFMVNHSFMAHDICQNRQFSEGGGDFWKTYKMNRQIDALFYCHQPLLKIVADEPDFIDSGGMDIGTKILQDDSGGKIQEIENFTPGQVKARVFLAGSQNGLLFYRDSFDPGWSADVDGKPSFIYKANKNFKAVKIPPGNHVVQFFYHSGVVTALMQYGLVLFSVLFSGFIFRMCLKQLTGACKGSQP